MDGLLHPARRASRNAQVEGEKNPRLSPHEKGASIRTTMVVPSTSSLESWALKTALREAPAVISRTSMLPPGVTGASQLWRRTKSNEFGHRPRLRGSQPAPHARGLRSGADEDRQPGHDPSTAWVTDVREEVTQRMLRDARPSRAGRGRPALHLLEQDSAGGGRTSPLCAPGG